MSSPAIQEIFRDAINAAIPDALLTGSEWADTYRYVSQGPRRGQKWTMDTVPYFVEPLNCINDSRVRTIVFMSPSRVGKTEGLLLNAEGYWMHHDPGPMMHLRPTLDDAKLFSRERHSSFIEETPVLRELMEDRGSTRDGDNTLLYKKFLGGYTYFTGANSPRGLIAQDFQRLLADEIDAYPVNAGGYGDPLDLANVRLRNYEIEGLAQSIFTSSPTIKCQVPPLPNQSRIEMAYNSGDQRRLFVPCMRCGEFQEILWSSIVWTELGREAKDACFVCPICKGINEEDEKPEMLAHCEWRAHAPFVDTASFWLWGTYSPWITWGGMAKELTEAYRAKSYEKYQVWCNSTWGWPWEEGEGIDEKEISYHREDYPAPVPAGVLLLTAGADTHPDRIEVEILGTGLEEETWSIAYKVFYGDPNQYPSPIWDDFEDFLLTRWQHELGVEMQVSGLLIDSAGGCTDGVYKFTKANEHRRWFASIGASKPGRPIAPKKPSRVGPMRAKLFTIGTEAAKDKASAALRVQNTRPKGMPEGGPGYCHFPITYPPDYFKQLASEKRVPHVHLGFHVWRWVTIKAGARNEPWDCRVYNLAIVAILKPNFERLRERLLGEAAAAKEERRAAREKGKGDGDDGDPSGTVREGSEDPNPTPDTRHPAPPPSFRMPRRRGGFVKKW
jgi:phage terminase large subunit GpA-like protein